MDEATGRNCGVRIEDLAMLCKPARVVLIPLEFEDDVPWEIDGSISEEERIKAIETENTLSKTKRGKNKNCEIEYECKLNATERRIIELIEANNFEDYGPAIEYEKNPTLPKTKLRKNKKRKTEFVECKLNDTERRLLELIEANDFEGYDYTLPTPISFSPNSLNPKHNYATTTERCEFEPGLEITRKIYNFPCRYCKAIFYRPENFKNHERTHNEYVSEDESEKPKHRKKLKKPTVCTKCGDTSDGPVAIKAHELFHEEGVKYTCQQCRYGFDNIRTWQYHNQTKHNDKYNYVCEFCGAHFKLRNVWMTHLRIHATNKSFVCQTCGASFLTPFRLATHEKRHNRSKDFSCDFCEESFYTAQGHRMHTLRYHGRSVITSLPRDIPQERHGCKICHKSFTRASYLKVHLTIHSGEMPYKCQNCPRHFVSKGTLNRHIIVAHGGESVKVQCEHCGKLCKHKECLVRHVKYHHSGDSEVLVVCDICGKMIRKKLLRNHKKCHDTQTFKCNQCSYTTNQSKMLKRHNFRHSKEKRYHCTSCTASYRSSITLKKHKLTHKRGNDNDSNSVTKN